MTTRKAMTIPAVFCLLLLSTVAALHAQDRMRAGNWENTVTAADGQTVTRSACLSAYDAAMSNGSPEVIRSEVERAVAESGRCKLKDF